MITTALTLTTALLAIAAGILANSLRNRDKELEAMAESYNMLREELTQTQAERAKSEQAKVEAEKLRDRIEKAAKVVEEDRDVARAEAMQFAADLNTMQAERASLYFRNSKGQIEPITPKESKPHTLKHGMTVKDPTPYNAKRIFAAAKRAGIHIEDLTGGADVYVLVFSSKETNLAARDAILVVPTHVKEATYISAREFLRRIKGEIE
jgi:hypothetical protein